MFESFVQKKLENYVKAYFKKHSEVKLVVVGGSVGKTSTKIAIATVLSEKFRVRLHRGNHNSFISTPLAILGIDYPEKIRSIGAWLTVFKAARQRINLPTDVDIIIQEIGSDRIGQIAHFGTYLKPDIGVVTAVAPEHMQFFQTIESVATEELALANYSKQALINRDDIDGNYSKYLTNSNLSTYGTNATAEYHYISQSYTLDDGHNGIFIAPEWNEPVPAVIHVLGEYTIRPAVAAGAVAVKLGMSAQEVATGLSKIQAVPGRMNVLRGANDAIIIDDSYNSSPLAAASALRTLYQLSVSKRIAVLGDMNELGTTSAIEHEDLGRMCDPVQLLWVVTVGPESGEYLAPAAKARGCQVKKCKTALQAGAFVRSIIENEAGVAVLFKGSENGIFLEEAIKMVLHSTSDESQLIRQSQDWMERKNAFFNKNS
jgi:UDP-N-acetylmuramoyl-tripeptide--D-alanyl-D-alanine ligase